MLRTKTIFKPKFYQLKLLEPIVGCETRNMNSLNCKLGEKYMFLTNFNITRAYIVHITHKVYIYVIVCGVIILHVWVEEHVPKIWFNININQSTKLFSEFPIFLGNIVT